MENEAVNMIQFRVCSNRVVVRHHRCRTAEGSLVAEALEATYDYRMENKADKFFQSR